ncbi:SAM-dependent methyltransferase [Caproiciproducens sp. AGMB10547]|uniref:SAM-dependent methyltransferase n=2 Tax=Caproiciproducens faecalis TaxID=2820301 RepID=A0ABS7DQ02_9FIRM|nr:SAM-dependent methyltransferase [Caproiciproducens faecalis]
MVRPNMALADIGTDHAYLPIWLAKQGLVSRAIAADIRPGPLQSAQQNIRRYRVEELVSTRLSNGLEEIFSVEADDIVIAGMGGEMMIQIIENALWLRQKEKRLILQPMTSIPELREYLAKRGFAVLREQAVVEDGHAYSVMQLQYAPEKIIMDSLYPYIGKLDAATEDNREYMRKVITQLEKKAGGLSISGKLEEAAALKNTAEKIRIKMEKER